MINILPYNQKKSIRKIRYMRIATFVILGLILLLVISIALFLPTLHTINTRYALADTQMRRLEQSGSVVKKIDVLDLKQRTQIMTEKLASTLPLAPLDYVKTIRSYEKDGIRLVGFSINDAGVVALSGVANTRQSLQNFVSTLQADPGIVSVDSPVTNFIKNSQSEFLITVTFKKI